MSKPNFRDATNAIAKECERLPEGWEIALRFSADEASLMLFDPNGDEVEVHVDEACHIQTAIDIANEIAPDFIYEADRCARCRGCGMVTEWVGSIPGDLEMSGGDCPDCGGSGRKPEGGAK